MVLASRNGSVLPQLKGEIIPVLADGALYGIDVGDGSVVWRKFVGLETEMHPLQFGPQSTLMADQKNHDLSLLRLADGQTVWRSEIGEPFMPPTFNEEQIVVTTNSGKVLNVDPASGKVLNAIQLPKAANVAAVISDRNPYVYQPGLYSNLYVLSKTDLSCQEVYYLGHARESISIPPAIWSSYVVVAVNRSGFCDLHVLKPMESGLKLRNISICGSVKVKIVIAFEKYEII